jgi:ATP-dependent helicase/nuclease subunit A
MRALTAEQEQAVARRRGALTLTAGAGSGKTSVLVERFVRAVHEDGVAPVRILAITFTERAAGELRERIRAQLLKLGHRDGAREAEEAMVGTFHGFCARLLRAHPLPAGLEPGFRVMEEGLADRLRRLAFGEALAQFLAGEPEGPVDLAAAYGVAQLERLVLDAHGELRSRGESHPRLPPVGGEGAQRQEPAPDAHARQTCALIDELLGRFDAAYEQAKRRRRALDFDDLELRARDLLRDHAVIRQAWAERFEMLMVDEFQDTNPRQLRLLELLDRDNLFTVGDAQQSIYGFRHADVALFAERRERLRRDGAALVLTHNFRSRPAILAAVDGVFAARLGEGHLPLHPARERHGQEPRVELLLTDCRGWQVAEGLDELPEATPWRAAEARLLATRVAQLVQSGRARPADVAVLLRSLGDLPLYEAALRLAGLPTLASTGGFWGQRQVGDLLACARALANPLDELALYSTLASPMAGLSSDGLALLARAARARGCSAWEAIEGHGAELEVLLPAVDRERLRAFRGWFADARRAAPLRSLAEMLGGAIAASGYDAHVLSLRWGERRMANVHKLLRLAREYEAQEGRDLRGFLDHVSHLSGAFAGREAEAPAAAGDGEAVRLMSVHAAKGLEFDVVCVADLGRTPRASTPDLLLGADGRLGLRLRTLREPQAEPALDYDALAEECKTAQQAEEDRILYVAMTRARERLLLSGALDLSRWPAPRPGGAPIAWLAPALVPEVHSLAQGPRESVCEPAEGLAVRCVFHRPGERCEQPAEPAIAPAAGERPAELTLFEHAWPVARRGGGQGAAEAEPAIVPLSDRDATVSYSSLAELERCGYRHYLERVLGLPEDLAAARPPSGRGRLDPRTRGTAIHLALERADFARGLAPSERQVALAARAAGIRLAPADRAEVAGLVTRALAAPLAARLGRAKVVCREHPFAFSLGPEEPIVTGVIDLLAHERAGEALIVDYKSDRVAEQEDLEALVRREYELQRLLYGLAAIEQGATRVEVAHWFLERPQEMICATFTADQAPALRARLTERLASLRTRGYAVAPEPHRALCLTCPGRARLCSWPPSRTLAEEPSGPAANERVATLTV